MRKVLKWMDDAKKKNTYAKMKKNKKKLYTSGAMN